MLPAKKVFLKKGLNDLMESWIISECETPWPAPVVLNPKPNKKNLPLCRLQKLNAIDKTNSYLLLRIDLLHKSKHIAFMSIIDLKSDYHQVELNHADRDKTTFVCLCRTYHYNRMFSDLHFLRNILSYLNGTIQFG